VTRAQHDVQHAHTRTRTTTINVIRNVRSHPHAVIAAYRTAHVSRELNTPPPLPLLKQAQDGARLGSAGTPYEIVQHHESSELTIADDGGYECYRHAAG